MDHAILTTVLTGLTHVDYYFLVLSVLSFIVGHFFGRSGWGMVFQLVLLTARSLKQNKNACSLGRGEE